MQTAAAIEPSLPASLLALVESKLQPTEATLANVHPTAGAFMRLEKTYQAALAAHAPMSLTVLRVTNLGMDLAKHSPEERLALQASVMRQLSIACGVAAPVAPIGDDEFAILLVGTDSCAELVGMMRRLLSRARAGGVNGDGQALLCRAGIARAVIDHDCLGALLAMASSAAAEPIEAPSFEFVGRRHQQRSC